MPVTAALRSAKNRPVFGDAINRQVHGSSSRKGQQNMTPLPKSSQRPPFVVTEDVDSINLNGSSNGKDKTLIVQQDESTQQPIKTKRVDVSASEWDDIASDTIQDRIGDDRRVSIVSPTYSEEYLEDDDDVTIVEEVPGKFPVVDDATCPTTTLTSETADHTKVVKKGYIFKQAFLTQKARECIRPLEGETVEQAITSMKAKMINAMADGGKGFKTVVEDNDKYNLLTSHSAKSKLTYKCLYVLGTLTVVEDTLAMNLPPTIIKSCELGRTKALEWIGGNKPQDLWVPEASTVYGWFRDFVDGRFFRHPERKFHLLLRSMDHLNKYFETNPVKKQTLKAHFQRVLKNQRSDVTNQETTDSVAVHDGTLDGNAYDFFRFFIDNILCDGPKDDTSKKASKCKRSSKDKEEETSAQAYADRLAKQREHLASFGFKELTWVHFSTWVNRNFGELRGMSDPV